MRAPISGRLRYVEISGRNLPGGCLLDRFESREARRLEARRQTTDAGDGKPDITGKFGPGDTLAGKPRFKLHAEYLHHTQERCKPVLAWRAVDESHRCLHPVQMPRQSDIENAPNSVAAWRLRRQWSQERLCQEAGLSAATVSRIETGGPYSHRSMKAVSKALGVPIPDLMEPNLSPVQMDLRAAVWPLDGDLGRQVLRLIRAVTEGEVA